MKTECFPVVLFFLKFYTGDSKTRTNGYFLYNLRPIVQIANLNATF